MKYEEMLRIQEFGRYRGTLRKSAERMICKIYTFEAKVYCFLIDEEGSLLMGFDYTNATERAKIAKHWQGTAFTLSDITLTEFLAL